MSRRRLVGGGLALLATPVVPAAAASLLPTPRQTAGPFYPRAWAGEADADLLQVLGQSGRAAGQAIEVVGRVMAPDGRPLAGVLVEIWQADGQGRYHYPQPGTSGADPGFQGYGRVRAGADGGYRFRTLKPAAYSWRTPHIHFRLSGPDTAPFTTQMYFTGEPQNARDPLLRAVGDPARRQRLIVDFQPAPQAGTLTGRFDIVLG